MFAPPQLIETEVFAAVPQNLRKSHVPAERIAAGAGGVPAGSFLEGPSFDRAHRTPRIRKIDGQMLVKIELIHSASVIYNLLKSPSTTSKC